MERIGLEGKGIGVCIPRVPGGHEHLKWFTRSMQVPPFWHGWF